MTNAPATFWECDHAEHTVDTGAELALRWAADFGLIDYWFDDLSGEFIFEPTSAPATCEKPHLPGWLVGLLRPGCLLVRLARALPCTAR